MFLCLQGIFIAIFMQYLPPVLGDLLIMVGIRWSFLPVLTPSLVVGMITACAEAAGIGAAAALGHWIILSLVHIVSFNELGV